MFSSKIESYDIQNIDTVIFTGDKTGILQEGLNTYHAPEKSVGPS